MGNTARKVPNPRLRKARAERGWSQQELAEKLGTTSVNISRWENGANTVSPYYRQRLHEIFEKTPAELGLEPESSPAARIKNIPITRNRFFTGREPLLTLLHDRLSTARSAALTQPQALYGLGGIGKTQTAAEYAFRHGEDYTHVFWVRAATRETLTADFVEMAGLLELPENDEQDQQRMITAVKRWLAAHDGWLLILDNADDLRQAQEFLPSSHKGYLLFTTHAQAGGQIAANVEVKKLNLQDGTLLLLRWTRLVSMDASIEQASAADRAAAERIVREMDGLPLAIVQAGAYIEETGCNLADYLDLYATHRKELLARRSSLVLDYPDSVATTWSLSFQQVEQQNPTAADVLRLCAFLAPDAIPEELLTRGADKLQAWLGEEVRDSFKFNEALEVLRRHSLVQRDARTHTLSMHRLVQVVLRENMELQDQRAWAEQAVRVVNAAFPDASYGVDMKHQLYLPHVQECAALITQYRLYFPEAAQLLYKTGAYLYFHGFHLQSQALHLQALSIRQQVFGNDHSSVAESLNTLAMLSRMGGDFQQAEEYHHKALVIRKKMLGWEHPDTAETLNNLGVLYRVQGKYEQAEALLKEALSIREQSLAPDHPDRLNSFINLAKLYTEQRDFKQAEQLLQQALKTSQRVMEPGHPFIAHTLNLLAKLYYQLGNYERAEYLGKQSLAILETKFGAKHLVCAEGLDDLAKIYEARTRYAQARSHCQRALNICERTLGAEHPDTVVYREHLGRITSKIEARRDDGYHSASLS